jgi:hypothetical protein
MSLSDRYIATVTGERKLYVFSIESGKPFLICKPDEDLMSGGSLINIDLDPFSGTYAVTSGSDRCIRLFDLTNSTCIEKVCAHAELITSVKFIRTNIEEDGLRVVSTCSDGTIFVWKVGQEVVSKMCARAVERRLKPPKRRVSVTPKPTESISQMIRGERKTFSTMSTAEQKYDELYKKIAIGRKPQTPPQKIAPIELGKLDRLYNGLPTHNKASPPAQYRMPPRSNPVLRRAVSRDGFVLRKEEPVAARKSPTPKQQLAPTKKILFEKKEPIDSKSKPTEGKQLQ